LAMRLLEFHGRQVAQGGMDALATMRLADELADLMA